jgi:hypothetical protein
VTQIAADVGCIVSAFKLELTDLAPPYNSSSRVVTAGFFPISEAAPAGW